MATMPGNRFVIPRISRTGSSVTRPRSYPGTRQRGGHRARPSPVSPIRLGAIEIAGRNLQRAGDDLRLVAVHQLDVRRGHGRVDLADAHAAVLQVEDQVGAALELALLLLLGDGEDAVVDALDAAREDALRELVLVDVDADAPLAGIVGRLAACRDRSRRRPGRARPRPARSRSWRRSCTCRSRRSPASTGSGPSCPGPPSARRTCSPRSRCRPAGSSGRRPRRSCRAPSFCAIFAARTPTRQPDSFAAYVRPSTLL